MAQVTVKINGFSHNVFCEDGQEAHLLAMAAQVQKRIDSVKAIAPQSGEARLLVLASLLMADELHDLNVELNTFRSTARAPSGPDQGWLAQRIAQLAVRAEEIAEQLEPS